VRPGSRTQASVPLVPPQNRHPERSASRIYRLTQHFWRESKDPKDDYWPMLFRVFRHQNLKEIKKSQTPSVAEGPAVRPGSLTKLSFRQLCHRIVILDRTAPGFPATQRQTWPRVRLSVKKAALSSPTPPTSAGNPG
jgi:hypothetical protein